MAKKTTTAAADKKKAATQQVLPGLPKATKALVQKADAYAVQVAQRIRVQQGEADLKKEVILLMKKQEVDKVGLSDGRVLGLTLNDPTETIKIVKEPKE